MTSGAASGSRNRGKRQPPRAQMIRISSVKSAPKRHRKSNTNAIKSPYSETDTEVAITTEKKQPSRERTQLRTGSADGGKQQSERGCRERGCNRHREKAAEVGEQLEAEHGRAPEKHHRELNDADDRQKQQLPEQKGGHRDPRRQKAVERPALRLLEERAAGAGGAEEEKHDTRARGVEGDE